MDSFSYGAEYQSNIFRNGLEASLLALVVKIVWYISLDTLSFWSSIFSLRNIFYLIYSSLEINLQIFCCFCFILIFLWKPWNFFFRILWLSSKVQHLFETFCNFLTAFTMFCDQFNACWIKVVINSLLLCNFKVLVPKKWPFSLTKYDSIFAFNNPL